MSRIEAIQEKIAILPEKYFGEVESILNRVSKEQELRRQRVQELAGAMKGKLTPLDDFLREKHAAGERW